MTINPWDQTRKKYLNWLNKTKLREIFSKDVSYKELSLWWLTKLIDKDNWNSPDWYTDLHNVVTLKKKVVKRERFFFIKLCLLFFRNLIGRIFFNLIFKILFKNKINKNYYKNCFYVIEKALYQYKNYNLDRVYGKTGIKNKKENIYFIELDESFNSILNFLKIKKRLNKIPFDYIIMNNSLSIFVIIKIYFSILFKIFHIKKKMKDANYFYIKNINCEYILKKLLYESFFGSIQKQIYKGECVNKNFKFIKCKNFLNYREFFYDSRSLYFFALKNKIKNVISINHSIDTSDNHLPFCLNKSEFSLKNNFLFFSPRPNYITSIGDNYYKKLSKIFKKKNIFKIGPLKKELMPEIPKSKKIKKNSRIIYLLCGLKDYHSFITILNKTELQNYKIILLPNPTTKLKTLREFKLSFKHPYTISNFNDELINFSKEDIFVLGDSSLGPELLIKGYKAIRLYDKQFLPTFGLDRNLPFAETKKQFIKFLNKKKLSINKKKIEKNYFYKFDNNSSLRLSKILNSL